MQTRCKQWHDRKKRNTQPRTQPSDHWHGPSTTIASWWVCRPFLSTFGRGSFQNTKTTTNKQSSFSNPVCWCWHKWCKHRRTRLKHGKQQRSFSPGPVHWCLHGLFWMQKKKKKLTWKTATHPSANMENSNKSFHTPSAPDSQKRLQEQSWHSTEECVARGPQVHSSPQRFCEDHCRKNLHWDEISTAISTRQQRRRHFRPRVIPFFALTSTPWARFRQGISFTHRFDWLFE